MRKANKWAGGLAEWRDGCLGTLPGVMNACCGHGESDEAYIQIDICKLKDGES